MLKFATDKSNTIMDSLTQIILGAAVAEAVAGKKMGNKAALWGAIGGTIPDLDVFITGFFHPIDGLLVHRGFSHSILFAMIMGPFIGWIMYHVFKKKFDLKIWISLFFWSLITHPMLDIFTNYGTEFFWPFPVRLTFNSVFVIDPLYTLPFMGCLIAALCFKKENPKRRTWNKLGIFYSTGYLIYGLIVKSMILTNAPNYFEKANLHTTNTMVTPMPLTSFYWMLLTEDSKNYYVGYKSFFYTFNPKDIDTIPKVKKPLNDIKWFGKNYSKTLDFISNGYFTTEKRNDIMRFYDLRFGLTNKLTNNEVKHPLMGFDLVIDNGFVQKTNRLNPSEAMKALNFGKYISKIFSNE
jgi:inner membrane protein